MSSVARMSMLVVGGSGFLGSEIVQQAASAGSQVHGTYLRCPPAVPLGATWRALDIRDRGEVAALVSTLAPTVIINVAYRQTDWASTADGAAHLALAAAWVGARLVHVSSDAVFSGAATQYPETALPDPITPYGAAKAAAETAIRAISPTAAIARTSLILGDSGSIHESRVHALVAGSAHGVLFTDDVRCPVHVTDLAAALLELSAGDHSGMSHLAGPDALSRYELGRLIARRDRLDPNALAAGRRADTALPGPLDVRLEGIMTQRRLRTNLRGAREFLQPSAATR